MSCHSGVSVLIEKPSRDTNLGASGSNICQCRGPRQASCPCGTIPLLLLLLHRIVYQVANSRGEASSCTQVLNGEAVTSQSDMYKARSGVRGWRGEWGSFSYTPQLFPL